MITSLIMSNNNVSESLSKKSFVEQYYTLLLLCDYVVNLGKLKDA